jgi:hypothetical protein
MKRIIISLLLSLTLLNNVSAQEVFKAILDKAKSTVESPSSSDMQKRYNQFKVDALTYMAMMMRKEMPDSSATILDRQAMALNDFVSLYISTLLEYRDAIQKDQIEIIKLFMDASFSNPLFNDTDKDVVLGYFASGDSLTRFSLDTDWQRAYIAVITEIKKKRQQ